MKIHINNYLPVIDLGRHTDKTILLSSSARSGSTFFANLLNHNREYRILFEPLSHNKVQKARELNFPKYLQADDDNSAYKEFFSDIIRGRVSNSWIDRENKAGLYSKRLIKEVRSNCLLPWINTKFPKVKVILLLRDPLSVINSWSRLKFEDGFLLRQQVLKQTDFTKTISPQILKDYKKETDSLLLSLYYWCINNSYPIKNCESQSILVVKYEDIVLNDESTAQMITDFTGIDISKVSEQNRNMRSSSSNYEKTKSAKRLKELEPFLSQEWLSRARQIMESFEMNHIYNLNFEN